MTVPMQSRIEQHPEFLSKIKGDAIELLKAIKTSMHEAVRAQKPVLTMIQSLTKWLTFKQNDGMNLSLYAKQFTEQRDVVKAQLGTRMFDFFVEQQADYQTAKDDAERLKLKNSMFEEFTGILFLLNSDQRKYGSIASELAGAYTRGRDEYPDSLTNAHDILETHVLDQAYKDQRKKQDKPPREQKSGKPESSFAQKKTENIKCYCCGDPSHKSPDCQWKDKIPKV